MTNTAIVVTGDTWVTVMVPDFNPAPLRRALLAAASTHPLGSISDLSGDKSGGLSGAAELYTKCTVDTAAELAADSLQEDGYKVSLLMI